MADAFSRGVVDQADPGLDSMNSLSLFYKEHVMNRAAKAPASKVINIVLITVSISFFAILNSSTFAQDNPSATKPEELNSKAIEFVKRGDYSAAIKTLHEAVDIQPDYASAQLNLGTAYMLSGDSNKALGFIRRSVELNPQSARAYNQLGVVYEKLGKLNLAAENLKAAVEKDPRYAKAHFNLGAVQSKANKLKAAETSLLTSLELEPSSIEARLELATVYARQDRLDKSIALVKKVVADHPANDEANLILCRLYLISNDRSAALSVYQSVKGRNTPLADQMFNFISEGRVVSARP